MDSDFLKYNTGKTRYELVPPSAIECMAVVLTHGAEKYGKDNWRKCQDVDVFVGAMYRHLQAWRSGHSVDEDSGLPHLHHAMTNLAFIVELERNKKK